MTTKSILKTIIITIVAGLIGAPALYIGMLTYRIQTNEPYWDISAKWVSEDPYMVIEEVKSYNRYFGESCFHRVTMIQDGKENSNLEIGTNNTFFNILSSHKSIAHGDIYCHNGVLTLTFDVEHNFKIDSMYSKVVLYPAE